MPTIDDPETDEFGDERPERVGEVECASCADETDHPILCRCGDMLCIDCIDDHKEECDA